MRKSFESANSRVCPVCGTLRLLTVNDLREIVKRGRTWIMAAVATGDFPEPTRIGGRLYWSSDEVQTWLNEQFRPGRRGAKQMTISKVEKHVKGIRKV